MRFVCFTAAILAFMLDQQKVVAVTLQKHGHSLPGEADLA